MNEQHGRKGPNVRLLLLVPAAVILFKGTMRRRAMWESAWGGSDGPGRRRGHHGRFENSGGGADGDRAFRLPPKIESMLDTWHSQAHQAPGATEPSET